jgi:prohibitin 2
MQNDFDFPSLQFRLPKLKILSFLIPALIVLFIILDGLVSVPAGHAAVIYDRGRGVLAEALPEGLHLKIPFWQTAEIFSTRLTTLDFINNAQIQSLTRDGQSVGLDVTIQFRISKEKASQLYRETGTTEDLIAKVINPEGRKIIRDEITAFDSNKLFAEGQRREAAAVMEKILKESFSDNHFELISVVLRDVKFSAAYLNSIEEKQIAEQKIQTAKNDLERIKIEAEQKITAAGAEAESIRLKGEQLRIAPEVVQFEFVQKMAPQIEWGILPDGVLPLLDLKK